MKNTIAIVLLLLCSKITAQSSYEYDTRQARYISKNNVYEILYDKTNWKIDTTKNEWDVTFDDKFKLIRINFIELSTFIGEKKIKSSLQDQFGKLGPVNHIKVYKKKINDLEVDYFELDLTYYGNIWKYQGFYYSGRSGTIQLDVRVQEEGIKMLQPQIDEFYKGFREIK